MAGVHINIKNYLTDLPGVRTEFGWEFPTVNSVNSLGKNTTWKISVRLFRWRQGMDTKNIPEAAFERPTDEYYDSATVLDANLYGWIKVDSGIEGGKTRDTFPTIVQRGKNIGKASATNAWTQALRDALGMYNKQTKKTTPVARDNGENGAGAGVGIGVGIGIANLRDQLHPPMLAQVLSQQKKPPVISEEHPAYVQRKYNGVRTVAARIDDKDILYSRRRNTYPGLDYIRNECARLYHDHPGLHLDGEIYLHGEPLQDISGAARGGNNDKEYDFMVYDCFTPGNNDAFSARHELLKALFDTHAAELIHVKFVPTYKITDVAQVKPLFDQFIAEGYEGAMVRLDAPYQYSYNEKHSKILLKVKPVLDAEYEIIGYETGRKGKAAGALMIVCKTPEGKEFPVTPAMELDVRKALTVKMAEVEQNGKTVFENKYKGKKIIIEFDEFSKDNLPQRARTQMKERTWD